MADSTTMQGQLKIFYGPNSKAFKVQQDLHQDFWKRIKNSDLKPSKKGAGVPVSMSGNESIRALNENESNFPAGSANPQESLIFTKELRGEATITGRSIVHSESNAVAFATAFNVEQTNQLAVFLATQERQALGKGTGQMSLANGAGVATVNLVVDNPFVFRRDMYIDAFDVLGGTKEIDNIRIVEVQHSTFTLVLETAQTWSDNAIIGMSGVFDGAPTGGKEITGFDAICDYLTYSSTFQNISPLTQPEWRGNLRDAFQAPLGQSLMQDALDYGMMVGNAKPTLIVSNHKQRRVFLDLELTKVRYAPQKVEAGHKPDALMFNDLEWSVNSYYDLDQLAMIDIENIEKVQAGDPDIVDIDGDKLHRLQGKNEYSFMRAWYGNLGVFKRNAHIKIFNLKVPA